MDPKNSSRFVGAIELNFPLRLPLPDKAAAAVSAEAPDNFDNSGNWDNSSLHIPTISKSKSKSKPKSLALNEDLNLLPGSCNTGGVSEFCHIPLDMPDGDPTVIASGEADDIERGEGMADPVDG